MVHIGGPASGSAPPVPVVVVEEELDVVVVLDVAPPVPVAVVVAEPVPGPAPLPPDPVVPAVVVRATPLEQLAATTTTGPSAISNLKRDVPSLLLARTPAP